MPLPAPDRPSRRRRRWTLAFAYTALVASCDSPFASQVEEVVRLEINPSVLTMVVGGNVTLTARVYGAGDNLLPTARVHWSSQNQAVVTITQEGVATAVAAGTAQIAASAGGQSRTIAVTVSQQPIALVRISPPAGSVPVGGTLTLQGEALDGTGALLPNRLLEWTSSAPEIATVNGTGVVTGVSVGEATISATGEGKTGTALVTVLPTPIATIDIEPNGGSLPAGATLLFIATPRDASGQALTGRTLAWRSSDDAVATVSSSGLLTAISPGTATITVSAPGGGPNGTTPSASVDVIVLIEPVASAVLVPATVSVQIGQTVDLTVNLFNGAGDPLSTAGRSIAWSSSNASVATINSSGGVTGVAVGTVTITATVTTPGQPGSVQASGAVNILPGNATRLVFTTQPPSSANSGQVFSSATVVQLTDGSGNNVPQGGVTVSAAVSPSAGVTLGGSSTTTSGSGTATFSALTLNGPAGSYTLTFSSVSLAPLVSGPITLAAGSGSALALTIQPSVTAQSGIAFATQPQVRLQDGSGNPVNQSGVVVTAAILTGGGTLGGTTTALTNASGVATFSGLSITGTVGPRTLLFGASGYTTVSANPIDITPGPAAALSLTAEPSATVQSGVPFASQPVVQLRDESGNAVAQGGVTVSVSVNGTGAALIGSGSAITNSSGVATFSGLGLSGTAGSYSLSFSASGLTGVTSSSISLIAGAAAALTITTQPAGASSGAPFATQPAIQLRDASGNEVNQAGVTVTASVASGPAGATLVGSGTATTSASGLATFSGLGISGTAGTYTLSFASDSLPDVTSAAVDLGPGAPAQLSIQTQPAGAVSGTAFTTQPAILVSDAQGNTVTVGVTVSASVNGAGASLIGPTTAQTNASGLATFSGLGLTGTAGTYTLDFAASGAPNVTSGSIALGAGAAAQLSMATQPSASVSSGSALATPPAVQLQDGGGNAVSQAGVSISVAISGSGASLTGATTALTDASGIATFTGLGISGAVGSYTLQFSSAGLTGTTSSAISVTPGPAAVLSMSAQPPGSALSGAAFSSAPAVQLRDASGNAVSQAGVAVTAAVTGGGATLVGSTTVNTDASGVATFADLGITGAGTWTIDFASTGLSGVTSSAVVVSLSASQLSMVSQPSATAQSGQTFAAQPSVRLLDSGGNPVGQAGVTVTAEITGGGVSGASLLGTASALTDASGTASFTNLGISGPVGSYTLTFKSSGLTDAISNIIDLAAGAAAKLSITQQPSGTTSDSPFTTQPIIQLRDAQDNPVSTSGVTVTATLNGTGGTLLGTAAVATNSSGQAGFTNLGISGTGTFTITFDATGLTGATSQDISIAFLNLSQAQPAIMDNPTADQMVMGGGTLLIAENTVGVPGFRIVSVGSAKSSPSPAVPLHHTPDTRH